jgi:hypothetical protein
MVVATVYGVKPPSPAFLYFGSEFGAPGQLQEARMGGGLELAAGSRTQQRQTYVGVVDEVD